MVLPVDSSAVLRLMVVVDANRESQESDFRFLGMGEIRREIMIGVFVGIITVVDMLCERCCAAARGGMTMITMCELRKDSLDLAEVLKHRVDHLEGLVDLLTHFRAGKDDFSADEDQKHNLGLDHAVDETREQLGLV